MSHGAGRRQARGVRARAAGVLARLPVALPAALVAGVFLLGRLPASHSQSEPPDAAVEWHPAGTPEPFPSQTAAAESEGGPLPSPGETPRPSSSPSPGASAAGSPGLSAGSTPQPSPKGGAGLLSGGAESENEPVHVDADELTYDRNRDVLHARGDVVITHGPSVLAADKVDIDRKQGQAQASGSVVLEDPQARIRADRAWFEIEDETGNLDDGEVYLTESRFQIGGDYMEKGLGQSYHIWDGHFTTCQCEEGPPDWSITGDQIDLKLEGWGEVHDGTFRVKDVPILYLPYGIFPIRRDRQSGFLFPRFGIANNRGFQWVQPYYWAINRESDATITADIETSARLGVLGEYRYALAPNEGGILTGSYFNDSIRNSKADEVVDPQDYADPSVPVNRGSVIGYHQQTGPFGMRLWARPFWISDNLFLRQMNVLSYLPTLGPFSTLRRYTDSRAGFLKLWDWGVLKGEGTYYQDIYQKQSRVPQPLPRLTFSGRDNLYGGMLRLSLNSELVEYWRAPLASGPRIDIAPRAKIPYRAGPYGYGQLSLTLRETAYYLTSNAVPVAASPTVLPNPTPTPNLNAPLPTRTVGKLQSREIAQLSADFNSEVSRVYDVHGLLDLTKVKHTIEPFLRYTWIPLVNQNDIPIYDAVDRVNARNLVTYGVVSRLLGKFGGPVSTTSAPLGVPPSPDSGSIDDLSSAQPSVQRPTLDQSGRIQELARAYLQQSYEISHPFFNDPGSTEPQNLSALDGGLRFTPVPFFGISGRGIYSFSEEKLLYAEAGVNFFDPRPVAGPNDLFLASLRPQNSASLFYQFNSGGALENLNLAGTYRVTNQVALAYLGRFDAIADRFLENWVGLRLISSCDCWVVDVAFIDRFNPDEKGVKVLFSLVGLGSFGQDPFVRRTSGFGRLQGTGIGSGTGSDPGGIY